MPTLDEIMKAEMDKGIKELMAYDLWPETLTFFLAKLALQEKVFAKYNVKATIQLDKKLCGKGYRMILAGFLLNKIWIFRSFRIIKFIDRLTKLHFKLRPKWYYEMDGHKLHMNEGDASMRAILKDYIAVGSKTQELGRLLEPWERVWEPETTKIVKKHVKPGDICLDIGASIGYFTLLFLVWSDRVDGFSPLSRQRIRFRILERI